MDKKLRNRTLLFLLLAGIAVFAFVKLSNRQPVAKIAAVRPVRQNVVASIISNGKVEPIAPFSIRAQLDTFVQKVNVTEGQNVKKGQVLLELDVKDMAAQLAAAKSKLLRAQEDLRQAKAGGKADEAARVNGDLGKAIAERDRLQHNHDALTRLLAQGAATKDELAANDLSLTKAQAEVNRLQAAKQEFDRQVTLDGSRGELAVQQAQSDVAALEQKVRQGRITAPIDGTLYALPVKAGDYVKLGDLLTEMADLRKVRVRAFIDEPEMGGLEPGLPVTITWDALPAKSWLGHTELTPKQVVPRGSRSVGELLCSVDNDKLELLPNTNVNVRINFHERQNVLTVPRGTVENAAGKSYVFVVKSGVGNSLLEKRQIQVGIVDATNYEVVSGLSLQDVIALPGDVDFRDGMHVRVVNLETPNVPGRSSAGL